MCTLVAYMTYINRATQKDAHLVNVSGSGGPGFSSSFTVTPNSQ